MADIVFCKFSPPKLKPPRISPPLGLLYLGAVLRKKGHRVRVLDFRLNGTDPSRTIADILREPPDILGFSALSVEMPVVRETARAIRKSLGNRTLLAVGGPHVQAAQQDALSDGLMDLAVAGEGEFAFLEAVEALESGDTLRLAAIPGVSLPETDGIRQNGKPKPISSLDELPFPAWDLVDVKAYFHRLRPCFLRPGPYMPIITSRGCPYSCIYCHNIFGKKFRARSPESVLAEMDLLVRNHGIREFEIQDDIFNMDIDRAAAICEGILAKGWKVKLSFPNGLRMDLLTPELLRLMKRAGTYFLNLAVETASERLQALVRKNLDLSVAASIIEASVSAGIYTGGNFMIGFPTETRKEIETTIDFACRSRLHFASFMTVTPFPGTGLEKWAREKGDKTIPPPEDLHFYRSAVNLTDLPDPEFFSLRGRAYRRFYASGHRRLLLSGAYRCLDLGQALFHYLLMLKN
ncbi:MAG: radical SAM protein [Thermodesulfobacteriota bacterium]